MELRILQVIPYFPPAWGYGGPVRLAYELSKSLAKAGHEVIVLTTDAMDSARRVSGPGDTATDIRIIRLKNLSNFLAWKYRLFLAPGLSRAAGTELSNVDLIHLHEYRVLQAHSIILAAERSDTPVLLQAHGSLSREIGRRAAKTVFDWTLGRGIFRRLSGAIALNDDEKELVCRFGIPTDRISVIPNAIEPPNAARVRAIDHFHKYLGLEEATPIILYLGRLHASKGLELLVKALRIVPGDATLVFAGPDDGFERVLRRLTREYRVSSRVRFTGFLDPETRLTAFAESVALVVPVFRGFPMTFLESISVGTPIITTNKGDRLHWIDGQAGYVVPFDAGSLARAIQTFVEQPKERTRLGISGKAIFQERFTWDKVRPMFEEAYSRCL